MDASRVAQRMFGGSAEAWAIDTGVVAVPRPVPVRAAPAPPTAEAAFSELIESSHRRLEHLAYMLCGDKARAEDAVAEAYARVWPRYRRGRVREPLAYLRRAVVNQVTGSYRRRAIEEREAQRWTVDRGARNGEAAVDDSELLRPALLTLPSTQRAVIVLRFLEDLSEQETAELLGLKPGTVKSRTARGLEQLRRLLEDDRG
jgi:RNA polymerase sigma-70 factor (sigma-E family)